MAIYYIVHINCRFTNFIRRIRCTADIVIPVRLIKTLNCEFRIAVHNDRYVYSLIVLVSQSRPRDEDRTHLTILGHSWSSTELSRARSPSYYGATS